MQERARGLVILDRDGVINEDSEQYIKSLDEWRPIAGSIEAIARLSQSGYTVAVATNQSGLARGLFSEQALMQMHQRLFQLVADAGGLLDTVFYCPHGPDEGCACRKPRTALLEAIADSTGLSLSGAPLVGDSEKDLLAAVAAGCQPVLVLTGKGVQTAAALSDALRSTTLIYDNLATCVDALLDATNHSTTSSSTTDQG